jgi:hypothetical protein
VPKIRLTELSIKGAKPLATQYTLWDSTLPNFGLRVSPGGTKNHGLALSPSLDELPNFLILDERISGDPALWPATLYRAFARPSHFRVSASYGSRSLSLRFSLALLPCP